MRRSGLVAVLGLTIAVLFVSVAPGCGSSDSMCDPGPCTTSTGGAGTGGSGGAAETTFPCKGLTCTHGTQACTVTSHFQENDMGACTALPAACMDATADCTCFGDLMGCVCEKQPSGDFAIFCNVNM